MQLLFILFIVLLLLNAIAFGGKDQKKTADLAAAVFKFIYNNEQICGDMFVNASVWFPARHNCELRCRLDTEICQMSSEAMPIRRQRCNELPPACRRHLKKLVGGAALYTKPNKRRNPLVEKQQQQQMRNSSSGGTNRTKNGAAPAAHKLEAKMQQNSPTNALRQIRINTSSTRKPPMASNQLIPLVKDLHEILIQPEQFHTTTGGGATKTVTTTSSSAITSTMKRKKPLVKRLPTTTTARTVAAAGPPLKTIKMTTTTTTALMPGPKHLASPVDDSLQRMFEQLYIESSASSTITTSTGGSGEKTISNTTMSTTTTRSTSASSTTTASAAVTDDDNVGQQQQKNFTPNSSSATITTTSTSTTIAATTSARQQWQSAEDGGQQPFDGNPFGATNENMSTAEGENATDNSQDRAVQAAVPQLLSATYRNEVFGPPLNPYQALHYEQQQQQSEPTETTNNINYIVEDDSATNESPLNINSTTNSNTTQNGGFFTSASSAASSSSLPPPTTTATTSIISTSSSRSSNSRWSSPANAAGGHRRIDSNDNDQQQEEDMDNDDNSNMVLRMMPKTLEDVHRRQIPWWRWHQFADALRQRQFDHSKSLSSLSGTTTDGVGILSLDKSVRCCHWALEGLCDRSWQRVRELCPKSCGSLVCSGIDGTMSCSRAIDVDVIACYEQRRRQQPSRSASLATAATIMPSSPPVSLLDDEFGAKFETVTMTTTDTVSVPTADDNFGTDQNNVDSSGRAFAVENEMKMFMESTAKAMTIFK